VEAFEGALDVALVAAGGFVLGAIELCVADVEGAEFAPVFGLGWGLVWAGKLAGRYSLWISSIRP
jgi:hypothetical protein